MTALTFLIDRLVGARRKVVWVKRRLASVTLVHVIATQDSIDVGSLMKVDSTASIAVDVVVIIELQPKQQLGTAEVLHAESLTSSGHEGSDCLRFPSHEDVVDVDADNKVLVDEYAWIERRCDKAQLSKPFTEYVVPFTA